MSWSEFYDTIIVENTGTSPVYVRTDGQAASTTAPGNEVAESGQVGVFGNEQSIPDVDDPDPALWPSGFATYVSLIIPSTAGVSNVVTVSVQ